MLWPIMKGFMRDEKKLSLSYHQNILSGTPCFDSQIFSLLFTTKNDEWMTCAFMSFSTVFQSYQRDVTVIMKDCLQCNPLGLKKICSLHAGLELDPKVLKY